MVTLPTASPQGENANMTMAGPGIDIREITDVDRRTARRLAMSPESVNVVIATWAEEYLRYERENAKLRAAASPAPKPAKRAPAKAAKPARKPAAKPARTEQPAGTEQPDGTPPPPSEAPRVTVTDLPEDMTTAEAEMLANGSDKSGS